MLVWTAFTWLTYIAVEPPIRRLWPQMLFSLARLLAGRVRDPLVGRDVLIGVLGGIVFVGTLIVRFQIFDGRAPDILLPSNRDVVRAVNAGESIVLTEKRNELAKALRALASLYLAKGQ